MVVRVHGLTLDLDLGTRAILYTHIAFVAVSVLFYSAMRSVPQSDWLLLVEICVLATFPVTFIFPVLMARDTARESSVLAWILVLFDVLMSVGHVYFLLSWWETT